MPSVEDYKKVILKILHDEFLEDPGFRVKNEDVEKKFGEIERTNFKVAREQLIQEGLIYGREYFDNEPPFLQITGEGLVYYEKHYILPPINRTYIILVFKFLSFLKDLIEERYPIEKYRLKTNEPRYNRVEIPLTKINEILEKNYNYLMNDSKWKMLRFTLKFINTLVNGMNGIYINDTCLRIYNIDEFSLTSKGLEFLNNFLNNEKFQRIDNVYGRNRVIQLYNDIEIWISKERWVDVAINMGAIIEYLIDVYAQKKGLNSINEKDFFGKLSKIIKSEDSSSVPIFNEQYKPLWNRIRNVLRYWRNYVHISKLVEEYSPLDKASIKNFQGDFEDAINLLLNI
ncbi:MAG: hypothetical protein ACTSPQ_09925 [Candidatus Helarchaeota archaeon]